MNHDSNLPNSCRDISASTKAVDHRTTFHDALMKPCEYEERGKINPTCRRGGDGLRVSWRECVWIQLPKAGGAGVGSRLLILAVFVRLGRSSINSCPPAPFNVLPKSSWTISLEQHFAVPGDRSRRRLTGMKKAGMDDKSSQEEKKGKWRLKKLAGIFHPTCQSLSPHTSSPKRWNNDKLTPRGFLPNCPLPSRLWRDVISPPAEDINSDLSCS